MPPQQNKAPDFIPYSATPDFIPATQDDAPPPVPAAPLPAGLTGPSSPNYAGMALTVGDALKGAAKGALHTISGSDEWARQHLPAVFTNSNLGFGPPANLQHVQQMATANNTAQKVGYGAEQIGEFLAPGGLEEKGATKLAELAPWAGKAARPLARVLTSALSSGAVNKAQGGSFGMGAAGGAVGAGVGEAAKAAAPMVAEFAHGINTPGAKTGKAILTETPPLAIFPSQVQKSARGVLDELNPQLDKMAIEAGHDSAGNLINPVDLAPARQTANEYVVKATGQGEPKFYKGTKRLAKQLDQFPNGAPLPEKVTPYQSLLTKRGVGNAISSAKWKPGYKDPFTGAQKAVYGKLNDAFLDAVPGAEKLNNRISALIPAAKGGKQTFSRYVSPAIGTLMGGYTGAMRGMQSNPENGPNLEKAFTGGLSGAALGGLTGYAAPGALNIVARGSASPALQKIVIPATVGAAMQLDRKKGRQADER